MTISAPQIDLLPEHLIDQIKAGEVIERPGNLLKEILENSIDAHATKLEISIKNNGLDLISLKDNGHGMRFDDLPLAFSRHATSKISRFEDLYKLHSFGFRGEALASIAAIAKIQCLSKTQHGTEASEIRINGGEILFHRKRYSSTFVHGTELIINDLFFNTPARLKFIQSEQSEKNFIRKIIYSFILSRFDLEFQLKIDEAEKIIYKPQANIISRVNDVFSVGNENITHIQKYYENIELEIILIPGSFKGPFRVQNIYINNRYVLDKQLHRIMSNGLESVYGENHFHYLAFFHLPPDLIDVNIHPNKTLIKVMEISKMISLLTSSLKELGKNRVSFYSESGGDLSKQQECLSPEENQSEKLHQQRHSYNMDGVFSPHEQSRITRNEIQWIKHYFIKQTQGYWLAYNAQKILEEYTHSKLGTTSQTIPLLVSVPYSSENVSEEVLKRLIQGGVEIEFLGPETLVLRGVPDWMNGFPLKQIFECLLLQKSFSQIQINPDDWSESIWLDIVNYFPVVDLINKKVALDLSALLQDKLK